MAEPSAWLLATYATVTGVIAAAAGLLVARHTGVGLAVLTAVLVSVVFGIATELVLGWFARREERGRG